MERITGYTTNDLKFVSSGLCPNCQTCADNWGYENIDKFNIDIEKGNIFDEGSFSWNPCEDCNTNLGGDSYYAHGIHKDELIHFTICHDCLMEFNGYEISD